MLDATRAQIELESELVRLALKAAEHHPILKAVYAGPPEWLDEARRDPGIPEDLIVRRPGAFDRGPARGAAGTLPAL